MIEQKIKTSFFIADLDELSNDEQMLIKKAQSILKTSYSSYSGFSVGASVLLDNGITIEGSNQENVAYPSGLCAERVALYRCSISKQYNQNYCNICPIQII